MKTRILHCLRSLLFTGFLTALPYAAAAGIIIDGTASDWSAVPVLAKNGSGSLVLKAAHDDSNLYFAVSGAKPSANYDLLLDTDNNVATGYVSEDWPSAGFDCLVQNGAIYHYVGPDWTWSSAVSGSVSARKNGKFMELGVGRSALPTLSGLIRAKFVYYNSRWATVSQLPLANSVATYVISTEVLSTPKIVVSSDANSVKFSITGTSLGPYYSLSLNTDENTATGYVDGVWSGSGCDYLVENGILYAYSGPGWSWQAVIGAVVSASVTGTSIEVQVPRVAFASLASRISVGFWNVNASWAVDQRSPASGALPYYAVSGQPPVAMGMKVLVPAYFYPGALWDRLNNAAASVPAGTLYAIANVNNGPLSGYDADTVAYQQAISNFRAKSGRVIGYVYTHYGSRAIADVKKDIDLWYATYVIDGIFLDEQANTENAVSYYYELYDYIKSKGGEALVVGNPGTGTIESYMQANDVTCIFESEGASFASWTSSSWTANYSASKFYVLPHDTLAANMTDFVTRAASNNVGWIYITNDTMPNPWDTLPDYFEALVSAAMQAR